MTNACVVDASAAAAVVFREPDALRIASDLFAVERAFVPQLFHLEVASAGRSKLLRGELHQRQAESLIQGLEQWPLEVCWVPWRPAWILALRFGLTVYDAVYLALARERGLRLLTLDHELAAADRTLRKRRP